MEQVKLGKNVYIDKLAHISGGVTVGNECSFWPGASVRGDRSEIFIGDGSNVQDNATIHSEEGFPVKIGTGVTIGHNAVVHGAVIGSDVIVGMGAVILDGTCVGEGSIIGAGTVIGGRKTIPPRSVVVGNPYRILRECTEKDVENIRKNAREYVSAAEIYSNKK